MIGKIPQPYYLCICKIIEVILSFNSTNIHLNMKNKLLTALMLSCTVVVLLLPATHPGNMVARVIHKPITNSEANL